MSATIHINEGVKDRLKLLARNGESDDELLQRLIRYVEEMDLEEINRGQMAEAAERKSRLHPSGRSLMDVRVKDSLMDGAYDKENVFAFLKEKG